MPKRQEALVRPVYPFCGMCYYGVLFKLIYVLCVDPSCIPLSLSPIIQFCGGVSPNLG